MPYLDVAKTSSDATRSAKNSLTMTKNDKYLASIEITNDQDVADELEATLKVLTRDVLSQQFRRRLDKDLIGLMERQGQRQKRNHIYLIESQEDLDALWLEVGDFNFLKHPKP